VAPMPYGAPPAAPAFNPAAPQQPFIADPVGLIAADGPKASAPPRFPGLLNLLGLGVLAGGAVVTTVLVGSPAP